MQTSRRGAPGLGPYHRESGLRGRNPLWYTSIALQLSSFCLNGGLIKILKNRDFKIQGPKWLVLQFNYTVIASKEDPLLTVGYDCIQNTFLNTCHDMCSVCSKRPSHTSPFLPKLIRLNSLGFAVEQSICY